MDKKKTFFQHLKAWIDGDEIFIDADHYIHTRQGFQKPELLKRFTVRAIKENKRVYQVLSVLISLVFISVTMAAVKDLPTFGDANNPSNNEVSQRYLEMGIEETGATNFVAGMILDYRAFDTFGEACVLFLAVMCSLMLLKKDEKNFSLAEEREFAEDVEIDRNEKKKILKMGAKYLTPMIMLYGIYVILNGHLTPGGGFSGGAIVGAGLIFYAAAYGHERMQTFFTIKTFSAISVTCLLTYFGCKSYSFFTGANHVGYEIPKGIPGNILSAGLILPLNICVGLVVACTMYGFYALFTKGDI